jgi:hypothetical protein
MRRRVETSGSDAQMSLQNQISGDDEKMKPFRPLE